MKRWVLILAILPIFLSAVAGSDSFTTGDYLFVKAQIVECGPQIRLVDVGLVKDTGQVALFDDILLETEGRSRTEIETQLVDLLEQRTGRKSKTIEIMRVSADDPKRAAQLMMVIHNERSQGCNSEPIQDEFLKKKDTFQIARRSAHNKSSITVTGDAGANSNVRLP